MGPPSPTDVPPVRPRLQAGGTCVPHRPVMRTQVRPSCWPSSANQLAQRGRALAEDTRNPTCACPHLTEDRRSQALLRSTKNLTRVGQREGSWRGPHIHQCQAHRPCFHLSSVKKTNRCHVTQGPGLTGLNIIGRDLK